MRRVRFFGLAAAAGAAVATGWALRTTSSSFPAVSNSPVTAESDDQSYAAATRPISGTLSASSRARIAAHLRSGHAVLIVLRSRDRKSCEDMGRQFRALLRAAGPGYPAVALVEPDAKDGYRTWMRREHVPVEVVPFSPDSMFTPTASLPTPAVLVTRDGRTARGVGHPVRFPNLRTRSFAEELAPLLN